MIDDFDEEDNIDIFNANFECDDEKQIIDLYNVESSIVNNDNLSKKIKIEKYNHPLFLNYNYCLFCLERRKTKYMHNNLNNLHNKESIKTIGEFLEKRKINLKIPQNKIEKLAKRRFIHSCETIKKKKIEVNEYFDSDTELYIEKEDDDNPYSKSISKKMRMTHTFTKFPSKIKSKKKNSKELKKSCKQLSANLDIEEDDIFKEEKKEKENIPKNNNIFKRQFSKDNNTKINKALSRKDILFKSSLTRRASKREEGDDTILNLDTNNSNSNKKKDKSFSIFGFITNYFYNDNKDNIKTNNSLVEENIENEVLSLQYFEKNEKCIICFEEIKDKFTLHCGDFFCRECVINLIQESLKNISLFDKIKCPKCQDQINESQIKFLLNDEYLEKYNKMKMRIEGLRNKDNAPCPYPDCEGFAIKEKEINDTLECQNGHIFCNKCFEIVDKKYRLEPKNKHECEDKYIETNNYLSSNKNIRRCPQCNTWIKRDPGGCNYFRCSNIWCRFEFCWICGKKYEKSHYRNPLSMCFGLAGTDIQGKIMIKSYQMRRIRCILIALLIILILLPIICILFSFFIIGSFIIYFQFDGKEVRNVRFHKKSSHKAFYTFYLLFFIFISLDLIPFGYICLVLLLFSIPILIIINKIRKKRGDDF